MKLPNLTGSLSPFVEEGRTTIWSWMHTSSSAHTCCHRGRSKAEQQRYLLAVPMTALFTAPCHLHIYSLKGQSVPLIVRALCTFMQMPTSHSMPASSCRFGRVA